MAAGKQSESAAASWRELVGQTPTFTRSFTSTEGAPACAFEISDVALSEAIAESFVSTKKEAGWWITPEHRDVRSIQTRAAIAEDIKGGADAFFLELGLSQGTRVVSVADVGELLKGMDLKNTPLLIHAGPDAAALAVVLECVAEEENIDFKEVRGCLGFDPVSILLRTGALASGIEGAYEVLLEAADYFAEHKLGVLRVSLRTLSECGVTPVAQLAIAIAVVNEAFRRAELRSEETLKALSKKVTFDVSLGRDIFPEVAKLRALRFLMHSYSECFDGVPFHIHAAASESDRTSLDIESNLLRETVAVAIGALGGVDSIGTLPHDATLTRPDQQARRAARNTQLVARDEAKLGVTSDPTAGAYVIEEMSVTLVKQAWSLLQDIENEGGLIRWLKKGKLSSCVDGKTIGGFVGMTLSQKEDEEIKVRPTISLSEIEEQVGRDYGSGSIEGQRGALLRILKRKHNVIESSKQACAAGVDLVTLSAALAHGRPSFHMEPALRMRSAFWFESARTYLRSLTEEERGYQCSVTLNDEEQGLLGEVSALLGLKEGGELLSIAEEENNFVAICGHAHNRFKKPMVKDELLFALCQVITRGAEERAEA